MNGKRGWFLVSGIFNVCFFTMMLLGKIDDQASATKTFFVLSELVGVMVGVAQIMLGILAPRIARQS
jgi:hypothetical protein